MQNSSPSLCFSLSLFLINDHMTANKNKKNLLKTICTAKVIGCGCGCGKPKLSDVHEPAPKPKRASNEIISHNPKPCSSSSSGYKNTSEDYTSVTTQNSEYETDLKVPKVLSPCPKIVDSIAVVKDSNDPYEDFRRSMLQMIMEKEIYSNDDLKELLNCFLQLNSPSNHDVIVQAFTGVWNEAVFKSPKKPCDDQSHES